jgi:small subunit ribosomal protein S6
MKHYETVFILTPVLSEQQMKETVDGFKSVITGNGGEIVNEELWGMRKLAYPIDHKSTGFYTLIEFDAEPDFVERLDTAFRRNEKVLRSLIFRLDKDAHEYAIKRRSLKSAAKAEPETTNEETKED